MHRADRLRTRRAFLTAAASGVAAAPFVRNAAAAGRLSIALWDHWVPGANEVLKGIVVEWASRERVDAQIDFISSQGNKLALTAAAEAQAKSGHDVIALPLFRAAAMADHLEPVDDVMTELEQSNGPVNASAGHLGKVDARWIAVPVTAGSQIKAACSRMDFMREHAGIDVQAMYPLGAPPKADGWTYEAFLEAARKCHRAGVSFGIGLGVTGDSIDTAGMIFQAFGASLVDARGSITVRSDAVRTALDYCRRLAAVLPSDASSWDDASNNKFFIAGKSALVFNPPSIWFVAKRDAPVVAAQSWTHGTPLGPAGRFAPYLPYFCGIWRFSKQKQAAKSLLRYISQPQAIEKIVVASRGYDVPPFSRLAHFADWSKEGPPNGTLYHYPGPHRHQELSVPGAPAPLRIAEQLYSNAVLTKAIVRHAQGEQLENVIGWMEGEIEGGLRNP